MFCCLVHFKTCTVVASCLKLCNDFDGEDNVFLLSQNNSYNTVIISTGPSGASLMWPELHYLSVRIEMLL